MDLVERFKKGMIVVNCQTEQQAKNFVEWCHANNMSWGGIRYGSEWTFYDYYGDRTCYRFNDSIVYGNVAAYEDYGYKVITYDEFMRGDFMQLEDLKNGYVVELRNGKLYLCLNNQFVGLEDMMRDVDCNYQSDMAYVGNDRFDVMKVYTINNCYVLNEVFNQNNPRAFNLVWERNDTKEMTLEEVNKIMQEVKGYKVKIIE